MKTVFYIFIVIVQMGLGSSAWAVDFNETLNESSQEKVEAQQLVLKQVDVDDNATSAERKDQSDVYFKETSEVGLGSSEVTTAAQNPYRPPMVTVETKEEVEAETSQVAGN